MSATGDKVGGKIKEAAGKVTGDKKLEGEGKGQHTAGKVEGAAVDAKKKVQGAVEKVTGKTNKG